MLLARVRAVAIDQQPYTLGPQGLCWAPCSASGIDRSCVIEETERKFSCLRAGFGLPMNIACRKTHAQHSQDCVFFVKGVLLSLSIHERLGITTLSQKLQRCGHTHKPDTSIIDWSLLDCWKQSRQDISPVIIKSAIQEAEREALDREHASLLHLRQFLNRRVSRVLSYDLKQADAACAFLVWATLSICLSRTPLTCSLIRAAIAQSPNVLSAATRSNASSIDCAIVVPWDLLTVTIFHG